MVMLSRLTALLLCLTIIVILFTCPFIRRTKKGLLFAHYALIFAAHAWETVESPAIGTHVSLFLLASSMLTILTEHAMTLNEKDFMFNSFFDTLPFIIAILIIDAIAILLHQKAFAIGAATFATGILSVAAYLKENPRKRARDIPIQELDTIADGTFFFDLENPINCLGRRGWIMICVTVAELLIGLVPYASNEKVKDMFIVVECVSLWLIFTLPVILGGFVQTIKLVGRHIVEKQLEGRLKEAQLKDHQDGNMREREALLSSVEEAYGDEAVVMSELV